MKIKAGFTQEVQINPKEVVEKLLSKELGWRGWVSEKEGKYYRCWEESAGPRTWDEQVQIPKDKYDYIKALQLVLEELSKPGSWTTQQ